MKQMTFEDRDFSYRSYRKLLSQFKKAKYQFVSFSEAKKREYSKGGLVIWRHDIDLALDKALEMAKIENKFGIKAVYFVFLKSPFYNLFSRQEEEMLRGIVGLGHHVGLHFDFAKYTSIHGTQVVEAIKKEVDFVESFFNTHMDAVSFHRPGNLAYYQGLKVNSYPHSYEPLFTEEFTYLSDSRARWRYGHPLDSEAFMKRGNLQLLIHPIWWNTTNLSGEDSIELFVKSSKNRVERHLKRELKSFWKDGKRK